MLKIHHIQLRNHYTYIKNVAIIYNKIYRTRYQDEQLKERKLQVLKDIFYPIEYEHIEIPKAKIDELIQDTKNYENMINILLDLYEETRGAENE